LFKDFSHFLRETGRAGEISFNDVYWVLEHKHSSTDDMGLIKVKFEK